MTKTWALRLASLSMNLLVVCALPWWLSGRWWVGVAFAAAFFFGVAAACRRMPPNEPASEDVVDAVHETCRRVGVRAPRFVVTCRGWTAGAVRSGRGYGLVLGSAVARDDRDAIVTHEIAHHVQGDLAWEPWTDGFARCATPWVARSPLLSVILSPFFVAAAPLARWTELRADEFAAKRAEGYVRTLRANVDKMGGQQSVLYPSPQARLRHSARYSIG